MLNLCGTCMHGDVPDGPSLVAASMLENAPPARAPAREHRLHAALQLRDSEPPLS